MLEAILANLVNEALEASDATTMLAAYINHQMRHDSRARAAYLATWGVEWSPLGNGAEEFHAFDVASGSSVTVKR